MNVWPEEQNVKNCGGKHKMPEILAAVVKCKKIGSGYKMQKLEAVIKCKKFGSRHCKYEKATL